MEDIAREPVVPVDCDGGGSGKMNTNCPSHLQSSHSFSFQNAMHTLTVAQTSKSKAILLIP